MVNIAKKHIRGEQLSAEQRQRNRSDARLRFGDKAGTPESQRVTRSRWQQQQDTTRQQISREFATAMLETFQSGERFMNPVHVCLLYTSPSPRDRTRSRMPSSA